MVEITINEETLKSYFRPIRCHYVEDITLVPELCPNTSNEGKLVYCNICGLPYCAVHAGKHIEQMHSEFIPTKLNDYAELIPKREFTSSSLVPEIPEKPKYNNLSHLQTERWKRLKSLGFKNFKELADYDKAVNEGRIKIDNDGAAHIIEKKEQFPILKRAIKKAIKEKEKETKGKINTIPMIVTPFHLNIEDATKFHEMLDKGEIKVVEKRHYHKVKYVHGLKRQLAMKYLKAKINNPKLSLSQFLINEHYNLRLLSKVQKEADKITEAEFNRYFANGLDIIRIPTKEIREAELIGVER